MNQVLAEILRTGQTETPAGRSVPVGAQISFAEGVFLQELIRAGRPATTLEVGLAYGVSALFICEALQEVGGTRHIVIDPAQNTADASAPVDDRGVWQVGGTGLYNLRRAGFDRLIEFHEEPSYRALARLEMAGTKVDFAFIDGWTTFDYKLVDVFFADQLLRPGGILVVRVGWTHAARQVCRYIATNLAYASRARFPEPPGPQVSQADAALGLSTGLVAFTKRGEDTREWNFHVEF